MRKFYHINGEKRQSHFDRKWNQNFVFLGWVSLIHEEFFNNRKRRWDFWVHLERTKNYFDSVYFLKNIKMLSNIFNCKHITHNKMPALSNKSF